MEATFVKFSYAPESKDIIMEFINILETYKLLQDKEGVIDGWDVFQKEMSDGLTKFLTEYRTRELDGTPKEFELAGYPNHVIVDLPPQNSGRIDNDVLVDNLIAYVHSIEDVKHTYHSPSEYDDDGPTLVSFVDYTHRRHITTKEGKTVDRLKFVFDWEVV